MNTYAVVIVTYNPDERIISSLKKLDECDFVKRVYIIDNTQKERLDLCTVSKKVQYDPLFENRGIAYAQNRGLDRAIMDGFSWAMTLDHDTIIENDLFKKYDDYIQNVNTSTIGIINSDYYDINSGKLKYGNRVPIFEREVISSGSLVNLSIFQNIGKMEERFFIDQVDNEFCYRLYKAGYKIVILPGKGFEHRLGNIKIISLGLLNITTYNQPSVRVYYRTRNMILFAKKYKDNNLKIEKIRELFKDFVRILFEKNRFQKIQMFAKGVIEGILGRE